jgi:uncharacterized membrane protein
MQTNDIVSTILPVHILAGGLALVFGYVALFATKGATLHRKSGMLFVYAMVALTLTGALVATLNGSHISVVAGLLTSYFVITALLTVRRSSREFHRIDQVVMLFALMWVAAASFFWGPRGRVPEAIRIPALLAVAVLLPVVVMLYWLYRIRIKRTFRGLADVTESRHSTVIAPDGAGHRAL